ncbi:MAG: DNA translocase FtsK [Archaeoglobus sp.]|nr:DNA translocase FtsK [Archaeoglobus sp.]
MTQLEVIKISKQEGLLTDVIQDTKSILKNMWRNRSGIEFMGRKYDQVKIPFLKKRIYLDNVIPGKIQDTLENLGFETKEGKRPIIVSKRKTEYGWHLVFSLPPGLSFGQFKQKQDYFADAVRGWVTLERRNGLVHMDILTGALPTSLPYEWRPDAYHKIALPVPVGVSQKGVEVLDLAESPHLLVAGVPGFGKSNFLHVLIHTLLPRALIGIIDMKRLEFAYLSNHAAVTRTEKDALQLVKALNREMERRIDVLEAANCVKVQEYKGQDMPYIVLVIDELAEIRDEQVLYYIDRIVRLARAVGISVVAATQRPSTKVINGDLRAMFAARVCYQVADELNSRMVLGENYSHAAYLPGIKGRAIYKFGLEIKEVQTMYLPLSKAKKLLKNQPKERWTYERQGKRLPPR